MNETLSIVIPAYNEEKRLPRTLELLREFRSNYFKINEILIVNDGSNDKTADIVRAAQKSYSPVKLFDLAQNVGKGGAVRAGMGAATSKWVLVADADSATPWSEMDRLFQVCAKEGASIAIGSRDVDGSELKVRQSFVRESAGKAFNGFVRIVARLPFSDTQCGFKLFSRKSFDRFKDRLKVNDFAWDIEVLMRAKENGEKICEVPVVWSHQEGSRISVLKDGMKMLKTVLKLRLSESSDRSQYSFVLFFFLLAASGMAALANVPLVSYYLALTNSDYIFQSYHSIDILNGDGGFFYPGHSYGGSFLAYVRALWFYLSQVNPSESLVDAFSSFHFFFAPALMTAAAGLLTWIRVGWIQAFFIVLLGSFGFGFWIDQYGNDFYVLNFVLCCLMLCFRGSFFQMSLSKLTLFSLLAGFSAYHFRPSLIVSLSVLAPWDMLLTRANQLWKGPGRFEKILKVVIAVLLGLFIFLDTFGEVYHVAGKRISLHRVPNLQYCLFLFGIYVFLSLKEKKEFFLRLGIFVPVFLVGFSPQIFGGFGQGAGVSLNSFWVTLENLTRVPEFLLRLLSGQEADKTSLVLSLPLLLLSLWGVKVNWNEKNAQIRFSLLVGGVLCVFAFAKLRTYTSGDLRYLFFLFPFLILFIALALKSVQKNPKLLISAFVAITCNIISVSIYRNSLQTDVLAQKVEKIRTVSEAIQSQDVDVVHCSDYWDCSVYGVPLGERTAFVTNQALRPAFASRMLRKPDAKQAVLNLDSPSFLNW